MRDARKPGTLEPVLEPEQADNQGEQAGAAERKQNAQAHQLWNADKAAGTVGHRDIACIIVLVTRVGRAMRQHKFKPAQCNRFRSAEQFLQ
jgi:hypothetical protein